MRKVPVQGLRPEERLPDPLYHRSGTRLYDRGERLTPEEVELLARHRISEVHVPASDEDLAGFLCEAQRRVVRLEDLDERTPLTSDVFDADGTLLLSQGVVVHQAMRDKLRERGITTLYIRRSSAERGLVEVQSFEADRAVIRRPRPKLVRWEAADDLRPEDRVADSAQVTEEAVQRQVESGRMEGSPEGEALARHLVERDPLSPRREDELRERNADLEETAGRVHQVYTALEAGETVDSDRVTDITKRLINAIVADHSLLLAQVSLKHPERYLLHHAFNTAVYASNIATTLGYSKRQVLEIAYGAFLQDVGMIQVPAEVLRKPGRLTPGERREVERHPVHGINYVQRVPLLPSSTPLVVYQHHERMDKGGYPRGRPGQLVHPFARISMVADVYDALTTDRPYRKALLPYQSMETLLRLVARKQLDARVVRAFLVCNSLFPVGSHVILSDDSVARVTRANPEVHTRPVVAILARSGRRLEAPELRDLGAGGDLQIVRATAPEGLEGAATDGF
ncbi:MAG: HD-GYP domain-containing protein [Planctomycetes bacterium]|nr:HD-GYP domain-containing protein [Planctomycetota bacterium]